MRLVSITTFCASCLRFVTKTIFCAFLLSLEGADQASITCSYSTSIPEKPLTPIEAGAGPRPMGSSSRLPFVRTPLMQKKTDTLQPQPYTPLQNHHSYLILSTEAACSPRNLPQLPFIRYHVTSKHLRGDRTHQTQRRDQTHQQHSPMLHMYHRFKLSPQKRTCYIRHI
jgi:hypothetical protein